MINYLHGTIIRKTHQTITVLVGGVGYEVAVSPVYLVSLNVGEEVRLFTHLYIREDSHELYGMPDEHSLVFFRQLISVSGVGPKSALHIFSLGSVEDIKNAIARGDIAFLTKVSGIGKKIAERIVIELKEKVGVAGTDAPSGGVLGDVFDALVGMGYAKPDARSAVQALKDAQGDVQTLLKMALKYLAH